MARKGWKMGYLRIAIGFSVVLCAVILFPRLNLGVEKYSTPSLSIRESKFDGVFVCSCKVLSQVSSDTENEITVGDVWIEKEIERYDTIPIRRRVAGMRFCFSVKLAQKSQFLDLKLLDCNKSVEKSPYFNASLSKGKCVIGVPVESVTVSSEGNACFRLVSGQSEVKLTIKNCLDVDRTM